METVRIIINIGFIIVGCLFIFALLYSLPELIRDTKASAAREKAERAERKAKNRRKAEVPSGWIAFGGLIAVLMALPMAFFIIVAFLILLAIKFWYVMLALGAICLVMRQVVKRERRAVEAAQEAEMERRISHLSAIANAWEECTGKIAHCWKASTWRWMMRNFSDLQNDREALLQHATNLHVLAIIVVIFATFRGFLFGIVAAPYVMFFIILGGVGKVIEVFGADALVVFLNAFFSQLAKLGARGLADAWLGAVSKSGVDISYAGVDISYAGVVFLGVLVCSMVFWFVLGMIQASQLRSMVAIALAVARIESKLEALETSGTPGPQ